MQQLSPNSSLTLCREFNRRRVSVVSRSVNLASNVCAAGSSVRLLHFRSASQPLKRVARDDNTAINPGNEQRASNDLPLRLLSAH